MPLIVPDARLVVDSNGPVLDRQARHRSQIRSESAVTTEQLPNEHAMAAIMMSTQIWARSRASLRPSGLTSSVETEGSTVNGSGRSQEVGTLYSWLRKG